MSPAKAWRALLALLAWASLGASLGASGPGHASGAGAGPQGAPDAADIMERSARACHYAGRDMRAHVLLELGAGTSVRRYRAMTELRWNAPSGGDQKYLFYFHRPGDVRRMTCMVWKHAGAADERWMYVPVSGGIRKILAPERSSFLGSEITREEFVGRDASSDVHRLVRQEKIAGRDCYVVESVPRKVEDFSRSVSWVDREHFLIWKQEFWNRRGELARVLEVQRIAPAGSHLGRTYPSVLEQTMRHLPSGRWTRVVRDSVRYDIGLREEDFSHRHMKMELGEWLRRQEGRRTEPR